MAWVLACGLSAGAGAQARTLQVGPGQTYLSPSKAIAVAEDGDRVVIAPGQYFDCAVVHQNRLTIEGASETGTVLTDKTCQGKALLVIDGQDITITNLTLTRARVVDGNGAGIRAEGGNLTVDHVRFDNNQDGILTIDNPQATLLIRNSEFTRNGICDAACSHAVYAGELKLVRVENSLFRQTRDGHHIKSRALRTEVVGCDIADGPDGTGSYTIDVPNGGGLLVQNNRMEKGPKAENHAVISIGEEGVDRPTPEITITGNQLRNDGDYTATFVVNLTATPAVLTGNTFSGSVRPLKGDGTVDGG
jgi:hypothetical protein